MLSSAELNALEYTAKESPSVMQIIVDIFPDNLLAPMVEMDGTAIYLAVCAVFIACCYGRKALNIKTFRATQHFEEFKMIGGFSLSKKSTELF